MMEIIGVVAEYNPFHNGHLYHLKKIKELYPNSLIILVLNGLFLERGEISYITKEDKTKIALETGVNIVLELPFIYGTQSSDTFADASVKILNNFNVTKIIFGSECNDINKLSTIALKQLDKQFDQSVLKNLKSGINYPTALAKALNLDFDFTPNDLLGISYIKTILKNKYSITPITIKRTCDYHDTLSNDPIISATNIREKLKQRKNVDNYLPSYSKNKMLIPNHELYFKLIKQKIITDHNLALYLDVDEGIEFRLKEMIKTTNNLEEFIKKIKTKRYTYNKINRMLIHIIIGLKKDDAKYNIDYIKILGFDHDGKKYLNKIKESLKIPTNINKDSLIYNYEVKASLIYDLINNTNTYKFEQSKKPIIK